MTKNEKLIRRVERAASVVKIVSNFVVPVAVSAVTTAATQHVMPSAPKIDTRYGKIAFKIGEYFLTAFLSYKTAKYVEKSIDDFVVDFKEGYEAVQEILNAEESPVEDDQEFMTVEELDLFLSDDNLVAMLPEDLRTDYETFDAGQKKLVLERIREDARAKALEEMGLTEEGDDSETIDETPVL